MEYPNLEAIRTQLESESPDSFVIEALKVCNEADHEGGLFMDLQTIAKLQFVERVLNG